MAAGALAFLQAPSRAGQHPSWIRIFTKQGAGVIRFYVQNLTAVDITATIRMDSQNLRGTVAWPYSASFAPKSTTEAFDLTQIDPNKSWKWKYQYDCTWGKIGVKPNDRYRYRLPFEPGSAFEVSQGYAGTFSHTGSERFAIDWKMPLGTAVCAARDGVVAAAKDDSTLGGPDIKYDWDANYILIRHSDGTYGHYAHLLRGGNMVQVGDKVRAGQWIALSGNTGYSTGPHLHFDVFEGKNGRERQTIPVRFRTTESAATYVAEGRMYQAPLFRPVVQRISN